MTGTQTVTAATIGAALIYGMALALLGRLKSAVARRVSAEEGAVRRWLLAINGALMPMVLLCGVLLDLYGARPVLVAGSALLAVALVSLSLRPTYPHAFASVLLAGFGASALGTASIVLMPRAFFAVEETSASLNLGFVFIALGALLTPVFADILLEKIALRRTLAVLALLSLTPAFLAVLPSTGYGRAAAPRGELSAILAQPAGWLAALVLFFYAPLEAAISLWTCALLAERGQDEDAAAGLLYGFWAAFMASRLLAALARHVDLLTEGWDPWLIVVLPLLAAVLLGNLAGANPRGRPRAALIVLGLLLGPVLPALLSLLFRRVAPAAQGTAYGFVFAAGWLGSALLAALLTPLSAVGHRQTALRMPIFLALFVTAVALVLGLMMP